MSSKLDAMWIVELAFFRWMNKNIDYVKVIKKMDYKLFVLKEQSRNEMIVLI